jgi:hypothetical protein
LATASEGTSARIWYCSPPSDNEDPEMAGGGGPGAATRGARCIAAINEHRDEALRVAWGRLAKRAVQLLDGLHLRRHCDARSR